MLIVVATTSSFRSAFFVSVKVFFVCVFLGLLLLVNSISYVFVVCLFDVCVLCLNEVLFR